MFANPPYRTITPWLQKAQASAQAGALVVCLLPSCTGVGWFQQSVLPLPREDVRYVGKRLHFSAQGPARFDSVVAIFRPPATRGEEEIIGEVFEEVNEEDG